MANNRVESVTEEDMNQPVKFPCNTCPVDKPTHNNCLDCARWEAEKVICWKCGGSGLTHHDCGEDTCCCVDPQDNVDCDICDGEGELYAEL